MKVKKLLTREGRNHRVVLNTRISITYNFILALSKIAMGLYNLSFFLCINAFYNLGIAFAKTVAIKGFKNSHLYDTHRGYGREAYKSYKQVGIILAVSAFIYILYSARLFVTKEQANYSNVTGITIALVTFTEIALATYGILTTSKENEPAINAIKMANLSSSLISLVLTQTAIMSFAYPIKNSTSLYNGLSGVIFGGLAMLIGLYMISHMSRILQGKNNDVIIKRFDKLIKNEGLLVTYEFIKYEDYGPRAKYLYIQMSNMVLYLYLKDLTMEQLNIELVNQVDGVHND